MPSVPAEHLVERVRAAQRGDTAEDLVAQARPGGVRGDRGDAHQHLCGDPDPGENRRPGERQFDPQQPQGPGHPDALRRVHQRRIDPAQAHDRVPYDRQQPVQRQRDHRRGHAQPHHRDQQTDHGEGGDGQEGGGGGRGEPGGPLPPVGDDPDQHADGRGHDHALEHRAGRLIRVEQQLLAIAADVLPEAHRHAPPGSARSSSPGPRRFTRGATPAPPAG